jgi:hypothetical protein
MLYYTGLMLAVFCGGVINNNFHKKKYLIAATVILIVIAGLRHYTVGVDSMQYYYSYRMIAGLPWSRIFDTRYEAGYAVFCKLLSLLSKNPQFLFFITALFIDGVIAWFIYRYSPNYWMSIYLYISMGFYYNTMNILRQSLALCIILLGLPLLLKKKRIWFLLIVVLAAQFHSSAWIALLLPLALEIKEHKILIYGALFASFTGLLFGNRIFGYISTISERYQDYSSSNFAFTNYFATAINTVVALVILFFYLYSIEFSFNNWRRSLYEKGPKKIEALFLFVLLIYLAFELVAIRANIIERVAGYYAIFAIIIIPAALLMIKNEKHRKVLFYFIITFTYLENMVILYYRPYWTRVVPYRLFMR